MATRRRVDDSGIIHAHIQGKYTYADARKAMDQWSELAVDDSIFTEIVHLEEPIHLSFTNEEEEMFIQDLGAVLSNYSSAAIAIVAKDDLSFGLSRMLELSIVNDRITIQVFRSEAPARQWIASRRHVHRKDAPSGRTATPPIR